MFEIGDRVKINSDGRKRYSSCAADGSNPLNFTGTVFEIEYDDEVWVKWDNGNNNCYAFNCLTRIGG